MRPTEVNHVAVGHLYMTCREVQRVLGGFSTEFLMFCSVSEFMNFFPRTHFYITLRRTQVY